SMTSTLLLSSLPMAKFPTIGRNDFGWLPTVSSSKSNLISPVFCACALAVTLPMSTKVPKAIARSAFLMSHASLESATGVDGRMDCPRRARWPNRCMASRQGPCSDDDHRQETVEPGLGKSAAGPQRIPRIWVSVRNRLLLDAGEIVDQGQHLALTRGA